MYARSTTLAILSAVALTLPPQQAPNFRLTTTGAISVRDAGRDARYGMVPAEADGQPRLTVSLGATGARGALQLSMPGARLPAAGRYPVRSALGEGTGGAAYTAGFAAGAPEHPLGWFHGESGTVTITRSENGRLSGRFEIQARGFLSTDLADEDRWVTVTGSFVAEGDSSATTIAVVQ